MTTHVLVESLAHAEQARRSIKGPIHWHSSSPVLIERLSNAGEPVDWVDETVSLEVSTEIGLACRAAVLALEPSLLKIADRFTSRRLVPLLGPVLAFFLALLCSKRAMVEAFAKSGGDRVVIGTPGLSGGATGRIGVGSFDTLFRNLSDGLDVQLMDGEPFDQSVLEKDFDRGTVGDRILSLMDISRAQLVSRRLRFLKASRIGPKSANGTVFVGRDNDTIREMLPPLLDKGYALARLPRPGNVEPGEPEPGIPSVAMIAAALKDAFAKVDISLDPAIPAHIVAERLSDASRYWRGMKKAADESVRAMLDGDAKGGPAAIMSNTIGDVSGAFQADAAEKAGVPTIIVEHGVSAGLSQYHAPIRIWSEPIHGAAYLVCAENASRFFLQERRLAGVRFHTIGLSDQTRRVPLAWIQRLVTRWRFSPKRGERVIMYLARASQNNFRKLSHAPRDRDLYELQRTMCRSVMGRLRGRAVVKLYSTRRYIDGDAFWDNARPDAPVTTMKTGDFRYLRAGVDIIILESPLSTIGWAFGAGKPIVFLADPATPLLPDVRREMEHAIFVIDLARSNWGDELVALINQPDAEFLKAWDEKEPARQAFLQRCVLGPDDPGRRGAEAVVAEIEHANGSTIQ